MSSFLYKKIWHGISIHTRKCIPAIIVNIAIQLLAHQQITQLSSAGGPTLKQFGQRIHLSHKHLMNFKHQWLKELNTLQIHLFQLKEMTLLQRNFVTAKPINFYYLVCKLDRVQYPLALLRAKLIKKRMVALRLIPSVTHQSLLFDVSFGCFFSNR